MAVDQSRNHVGHAVAHTNPCAEKVETSSPAGLIKIQRQGQFEERRTPISSGFAPVQSRMRQKNCNSADCERKKGSRVDPVSHANQNRVARRNPIVAAAMCCHWPSGTTRGPGGRTCISTLPVAFADCVDVSKFSSSAVTITESVVMST